MATEYCNLTSDLRDAFAMIEDYRGLKRLKDWELSTGNIYKIDQSGYVETVFENGTAMTAGSTTSPAAGEYYYDATNDILYAQTSDSVNPSTKTMEGGYDWNTLKTRCRNDAQEMLEALLGRVYQVPFQKIAAPDVSYNSRSYDYAIRKATALLTCSLIIEKVNGNDPNAERLRRKVDNPDPDVNESLGIVQRILAGDITLKTQTNAREAGGWNVFETLDGTSTLIMELSGRFTGSQRQVWRLEIDLGGTPGTATYKLSKDGGTTFDETGQETRDTDSDNQRVYLGSGIYARFTGTAVLADYFDIDLRPLSDEVTIPTMGSVTVTR